ncbi:AI-2E family transporter [Patescibacteria group bacterium]|jgi:predicted PurR-regulated permease PerM|nr:AI-2E family transporter [Patescibacteria group bacterium]
MQERPLAITITPGTIVTIVLILIAFALVYALRETVLIILAAVVIASAIEPAVRSLSGWGLPRVVSVLSIYLVLVALLVGFFYALLPPLVREASNFIANLPALLETLSLGGAGTQSLVPDAASQSALQSLRELQATFASTGAGLVGAIGFLFGGVFSFILMIVLSFYLTVQERGIDDFIRLVTPARHQAYALDLWRRSQVKIGRWLQGQIILSVIVALAVYVGLSVLGVEYALLLAMTAGLLELVPVFGSILAAIPAVIVAFLGGGAPLALLVIALYVIVNQVQGNLVYPLVVQKVVGVPPLLVILSLIIGLQLAGFWGVLLAVPIAAILREFVSDLGTSDRRSEPAPENATT